MSTRRKPENYKIFKSQASKDLKEATTTTTTTRGSNRLDSPPAELTASPKIPLVDMQPSMTTLEKVTRYLESSDSSLMSIDRSIHSDGDAPNTSNINSRTTRLTATATTSRKTTSRTGTKTKVLSDESRSDEDEGEEEDDDDDDYEDDDDEYHENVERRGLVGRVGSSGSSDESGESEVKYEGRNRGRVKRIGRQRAETSRAAEKRVSNSKKTSPSKSRPYRSGRNGARTTNKSKDEDFEDADEEGEEEEEEEKEDYCEFEPRSKSRRSDSAREKRVLRPVETKVHSSEQQLESSPQKNKPQQRKPGRPRKDQANKSKPQDDEVMILTPDTTILKTRRSVFQREIPEKTTRASLNITTNNHTNNNDKDHAKISSSPSTFDKEFGTIKQMAESGKGERQKVEENNSQSASHPLRRQQVARKKLTIEREKKHDLSMQSISNSEKSSKNFEADDNFEETSSPRRNRHSRQTYDENSRSKLKRSPIKRKKLNYNEESETLSEGSNEQQVSRSNTKTKESAKTPSDHQNDNSAIDRSRRNATTEKKTKEVDASQTRSKAAMRRDDSHANESFKVSKSTRNSSIGQGLGSIEELSKRLEKANKLILKILHFLCYDRDCKSEYLVDNLKCFDGFPNNADIYGKKMNLEDADLSELRSIAQILGLPDDGRRNNLTNSIIEFLRNPIGSSGNNRTFTRLSVSQQTAENSLNKRNSGMAQTNGTTSRQEKSKSETMPKKRASADVIVEDEASQDESYETDPSERVTRNHQNRNKKSKNDLDLEWQAQKSEASESETTIDDDHMTRAKNKILDVIYREGYDRDQVRALLLEVFKEFRF